MALWKNTQHSFASGQLDANVMGRQDLDRYYSGATLLRNFLVKRQGCVSKRRGTDLCADLTGLNGNDADGNPVGEGAMRLIPVSNDEDGRYIVLSGGAAYTANRDGVLLSGGTRVRSIPAYAAKDSDGNPVTSVGTDDESDDDLPITVVHRLAEGDYEQTKFSQADIQSALDKAVDGDRIVLHGDLIFLDQEKPEFRSEAFTPSDGVASTFAYSGSKWQMTRGGTTYADTSAGRTVYVPQFKVGTVTAKRMWTFAADGGHANRSYAVKRYSANYSWWAIEATDKATAAGAEDDLSVSFTVDGAAVTATRADAESAWAFSDGNAWTLSYADGTWTASRTVAAERQSDGANVSSNYLAGTVTATVDGETVVATSSWSFSDGGEWTLRLSTWLYFDNAKYVSQRATSYWGVDEFTFDAVVSATRAAKHVEFDLNGYDVRFVGRGNFLAQTPNVGVAFKSSRRGARVLVASNSNCAAVRFELRSPGSSRLGEISFAGDIEWRMDGGTANVLIEIEYAKSVVFGGGTFVDTSENPDCRGSTIEVFYCGSVTFGGGTFDGGLETGILTLLNVTQTPATVNGGTFRLRRPVKKNSTCLLTTNTTWTINGGRFDCLGDAFAGTTRIGARGEIFFETFVTLVRGEFSFTEMTSWSGNVRPIADYAHDGSVANGETHDGYCGVKVEGEADYRWTGSATEHAPYRVTVPYADADLHALCARQCGDTVFVVHPSYPPAKFWFDEYGDLHWEELAFDNTDVYPPVIDSAVMQGQDPAATERPEDKPDWLTDAQTAQLDTFYEDRENEGTMTDAGFSGNGATGSDGTSNSACTYTATVVVKDAASGKKTTHTYALSFTKTVTKEVTTSYTDGQATGTTEKKITTTGSAENDASAAVVVVPRTVRYVATYVKDGRESLPSEPVEIDYEMPWANNAVVNLTVSKGRNDVEPDYYNLYKDSGGGYGLVGTTSADAYSGGYSASIDRYATYAPETSETDGVSLVSVADYGAARGWTATAFARRLASAPLDYPSSTAGDVGVVVPQSRKDVGLDLPKDAKFVELALDARVVDGVTGNTMLVVSQCAVKVHVAFTISYGGADLAGTATATYYPDTTTIHNAYAASVGVPKLMCALGTKTYALKSGEKVCAVSVGSGDQSRALAQCVRSVVLPNPLAGVDGVKVTRVWATFDYLYGWSRWDDYRYQGAVHAMRCYGKSPRSVGNQTWTTTWNGFTRLKNSGVYVVRKVETVPDPVWGGTKTVEDSTFYGIKGATGESVVGGTFQDDYVTPDMTVTPPVEPSEAHFAADGDYPRAVGIHDQRLVLASTRSSPSTVWFSRTADLYSFEPHESVREDDAMELTLAATEFPNINHLVDGRELLLLCDGGEWTVSPVSGNALTYKTAQMKMQSSVGSDPRLQPLQVAGEVLFGERGGTALRAMQYAYGSDSYQSVDLTLAAQSLFLSSRIVSLCYKQRPDSAVLCVLSDGRVAALVYDKENEVVAWSVHDFGGGWLARQAVTPKCVSNGTTETMLLVQRGGAWQMWRTRDDVASTDAASQVVLDAMHVEDYPDPADGETAVPLGDGTYAHGLPVVSELVTVRPEARQGDTLQMELKNATECEVRVANASTFEMKPYAAKDGWRETRLEPERDGAAVALKDADAKRIMTGVNTRDGRIHLRHSAPWPITVLSVSTTYQVEYENGGRQ